MIVVLKTRHNKANLKQVKSFCFRFAFLLFLIFLSLQVDWECYHSIFWLYYIRIIILWTSYSQSFKNHFNWSIKRGAMQNYYLHRSSLYSCATFLLFNSIVISYQKQSFYLLKALLLRGNCIDVTRYILLLYLQRYVNYIFFMVGYCLNDLLVFIYVVII